MKNRTMIYTCPICCGSMLETESMEAERLSETERLQGAVDFLLAALKRVQVRPAQESAFIAAVCLQEVEKVYGISDFRTGKNGDKNEQLKNCTTLHRPTN